MTAESDAPPATLDERQLRRIEAVHRGFLYQHLYGVLCLLAMDGSGAQSLTVESDEDLEVATEGQRIYVQVKTRERALAWSDIKDAIIRFEAIRAEHRAGRRPGTCRFVIAANAAANAALRRRVSGPGWPEDVELHWPGMPATPSDLPRPAASTAAMFDQGADLARSLPFTLLAPETLVWKLAGQMIAAAAGAPPRADHSFLAAERPALFEQLVRQLQEFPAAPDVYRPQEEEPALSSAEPVRIVAGYSGAGKTSWASAAALHASAPIAYFDAAETPGPALAMALARELVARWYGSTGNRLGELLLPGASGLEILGALARNLADGGLQALVVLDNVHRIPPQDIADLVRRVPGLRFLLLAHPGATVHELEARLSVTPERLQGWSPDTIAREATERGCRADFATCERLRQITGGLPYYVQNALAIARREHDGNVAILCAELDAQTHVVETAQEIILERLFASAPAADRESLALLSIADVPISVDDAKAMLRAALSISEPAASRRLRSLPVTGALEVFGEGRLKVHDAMRLVAHRALLDRGEAETLRARRLFADVLAESIHKDWSPAKLSLLVRLFGQSGRTAELVEFATDELFHEMGVWPEIEPFLIAIAEGDGAAGERAKAFDGLVFNDLREGAVERALVRLDALGALVEEQKLDDRTWLDWAMKRMLALALNGDRKAALAAIETMRSRVPARPDHSRIFRYNVANVHFQLGDYRRVIEATDPLIHEYYALLGLDPDMVFGRNAPDLLPLIKQRPLPIDDLKHLADALDLHAQAVGKLGGVSPFGRIHALKFYNLAQAPDSMVRVGQDLVDEFCGRHDFVGARDLIERNLLPILNQLKLAARVIPVRSQYAVVLAYCGAFEDADEEMRRLEPYLPALSEIGRGEVLNQRRLIARLRRVGPPPNVAIPTIAPWMVAAMRRPAPARKGMCQCGSGRLARDCCRG